MRGSKKKRRVMDEVSHFTTLLGQKTRFVGTISGSDNCIVYGQVEGDCRCDSVLVLGEHGRWQGNILAPNVIISGDVEGNIDVTEKLELTGTARVNGGISSPVVAIEEGAVHVGAIRMEKQTDVIRFKEKREPGSVADQGSKDNEAD